MAPSTHQRLYAPHRLDSYGLEPDLFWFCFCRLLFCWGGFWFWGLVWFCWPCLSGSLLVLTKRIRFGDLCLPLPVQKTSTPSVVPWPPNWLPCLRFSEKPQKTDQAELALYADPTYWLYGLLAFCAKSCEAKTAEAGGEPDFRTSKERKQDSSAPALEPTRNSLALMQTVVMSFARGLYLGKPELPIDHVHVYFPVQIVHKVIAQCKALKLKEGSLTAAERYRHNVDNAANNPYVIVGVFEGRCSREQYPPIPETPTLAIAYEEGMLDASFGQIVSFASFYQTSFRVEVLLWHKLKDGIADPPLDDQTAPRHSPARETPTDKGPSPRSSGNAPKSPDARTDCADETADEETTEEESYVPATGQGCFSFEMSLLQRAAQTLRSARWLTTLRRSRDGCIRGSPRPSRGKVGTFCPSTAHTPLPHSPCFGYISNSDTSPRRDQTEKSPMLRRTPKARLCATGNGTSTKSCLRAIWQGPIAFASREKLVLRLTSFALVDRTVELPNIEATLRNAVASTKPQASASSSQSGRTTVKMFL